MKYKIVYTGPHGQPTTVVHNPSIPNGQDDGTHIWDKDTRTLEFYDVNQHLVAIFCKVISVQALFDNEEK